MELGLDILIQKIWKQLGMVRIYTKKKSEAPDFTEPIILTRGRGGLTIKDAIGQIHRQLLDDFSSAFVWGKSCKFSPMTCGLSHHLCDEDVLQIVKRVKNSGATISNQPACVQVEKDKVGTGAGRAKKATKK